MAEAAEVGDIFVTVTGDKSVIRGEHMRAHEGRRDPLQLRPLQRRDRHPGARELAGERARRGVRRGVRRSPTAAGLPARRRPPGQPRGRRGPPGAGDGHVLRQPGARGRVIVENAASLERRVYDVPEEIDQEIARLKLATMGIEIDALTPEQEKYLASWDEGT